MDCRFKLLSFQENCPKQCSLVENKKQKEKLSKENLMAVLAAGGYVKCDPVNTPWNSSYSLVIPCGEVSASFLQFNFSTLVQERTLYKDFENTQILTFSFCLHYCLTFFFVLKTDIVILTIMARNFRIKTKAKHLHIVMSSCWKLNVLIGKSQSKGFFTL